VSRRAGAFWPRPTAQGRSLLRSLFVVLFLGGCGPQALPPLPPPGDITSPIDGVIVSVDSAGLTAVRGFVLRVSGVLSIDFVLGPLEDPTAFPPGHLAEHQATSSPVRVYFRTDGDRRVVYRLEDAAPSPGPSSSALSSSPSG
jgi:hypothetical protein